MRNTQICRCRVVARQTKKTLLRGRHGEGQREPLDVYQRLVNANFNLNVSRTRVMYDFGYLALDSKGADAFRLFRYELQMLQEKLDQEPFACWRITPQILEANINA